jgi:deoxycytidylate deaminase
MNNDLREKILDLTKKYIDLPNGKNKHFSFIIRRNKILSIGWNDYFRTHPICKKLGYRFDAIHSETSSVLRYRGDTEDLRFCELVNTRINSMGKIGMACPCDICKKFIISTGIRRVHYTDINGLWQEIRL